MKLYIFGEGKTEERLMKQVVGKWFSSAPTPEYRLGHGKRNLTDTVASNLEPDLFPDQTEAVRCVILRDLDKGETVQGVQQSFTGVFRGMFEGNSLESAHIVFKPLRGWENILTLIALDRDLRVALHIAQSGGAIEPRPDNATTDDYILTAAMIDQVAARFAQQAGLAKGGAALLRKVTQEFPRLMGDNGVADLEAKDFLGAYMAFSRFLRRHRALEVDTFAGIVVSRALKRAEDEAERTFESLIEAVEWVLMEGGAE